MKLMGSDKEQIVAAVATQRLLGNKDVLNDMRRSVVKISQIRDYGEVSGGKSNRNLRTEINAYGYVIRGVPQDINKAIEPIMTTLNGFEVSKKFSDRMEKLSEEFKEKIVVIESTYPRAKDYIKNRIREARNAAKVFIAESENICRVMLAPLSNLSY